MPVLAGGYYFYVYQSPSAEKAWRWRFHGPLNTLIAVSGEGYPDKVLCVEAINSLSRNSKRPVIRYEPDKLM